MVGVALGGRTDVMLFSSTGYPRTLNQAELLNKEMKVDHVVALNVPNDEIVNRLKDRWIHSSSGRVYNLLWNPPKVAVSSVQRSNPPYLAVLFERAKMTRQVKL